MNDSRLEASHASQEILTASLRSLSFSLPNTILSIPPAEMAKKRKAPGSSKTKAAPEEDFNKRVRLNVDSYEDVAGSDDEFQIGRDKVLLDEAPADKRARKLREDGMFSAGYWYCSMSNM